jgi:DNA repair exonuclease SbcCD nuclease subunit
MSKRLIFSDIHFHPWTYGATIGEDGMNSRLAMQAAAADEMIEDAIESGCKYAYFCGDLFHRHGSIPTQALSVAAAMFNKLRNGDIRIRAIPGNHDMEDREGRLHGLSFLPEGEILGSWEDRGLRVLALPYTTNEETLKRFLGDAGEDGQSKMLMLHQGVSGVPLSSGYVLDERLEASMIPDNCRAFTGHYHFHRAVTPNLTVVGNLTPLNWGDVDQSKGWIIWDDETGEMAQKHQSSHPGFWNYDYEMPIGNVEGQYIRYTTPVTLKEQAEIRADLIEFGALTVEFPEIKTTLKETAKFKKGETLTTEHLLAEFMNSEMPERRKEVGLEVREERYEAPVNSR